MKTDLKIHGMDCAEEVAALKARLLPIPGVEDLAFQLLEGRLTVTHDNRVTAARLAAAVGRTGMRAEVYDAQQEKAETGRPRRRWGPTLAVVASGLATAGGFLAHGSLTSFAAVVSGGERSTPTAALGLYLLAAASGLWYVVPKAWRALRGRRADMNLLMTVAVAGAVAIGEPLEAATVAFLFALSLALESWSVGRARRAIAALAAVAPPQARLLRADGSEELVAVERVPPGSRIVVKPGERIPLDGTLAAGETTVDQSPLTGESMPVAKQRGDELFAGTVNRHGAIELLTTRPSGESTIAHIARLVREAQSRRSASEQWVEKFARVYTPAVMVLAGAVALLPPLVLGDWGGWFYQGLVLLVIACPCALVISTPVSIVAALATASRHGVLIKGGVFVEAPAGLRAMALDKTGTLTEGRPEVTAVLPAPGHTMRDVLDVAAAIERRSEHPLARAIERHAQAQGVWPDAAEGFQAIAGQGAVAEYQGRRVWLGSHRYLASLGRSGAEEPILAAMAAQGATVVAVGDDEQIYGFIALADRLRPEAAAAVASLKRAGIEHVVMLTGDNEATAAAIARQSGVDDFLAELLPHDKVRAIEGLLARYGSVGMVGDGINDAPALARATLGIAMAATGTAVAAETADVALAGDDLTRLAWLRGYSRRVLGVIRQNIIASLGVKSLFVLLALSGHASLWSAIAADMGVSLLVVFNALRLLDDRH